MADHDQQPVIEKSHRALMIGRTRSGKTVLLRAQYLPIVTHKLCIDVKGKLFLAESHYVTTPAELDWRYASQVIRPGERWDDPKFYEEVYARVWALAAAGYPITVWLDEAYGPTTETRIAPSMKRVLVQGAELDIRHMAAAQRPVRFAADLKSQTDHIIVMTSFYSPKDLDEIGGDMALSRLELQFHLDECRRVYGKHSHLWFETDGGAIHYRPPVPEWMWKE